MTKLAEKGLKSMGNIMPVRKNPLQQTEQLHKIPLNLKLLYATGPCKLFSACERQNMANLNSERSSVFKKWHAGWTFYHSGKEDAWEVARGNCDMKGAAML